MVLRQAIPQLMFRSGSNSFKLLTLNEASLSKKYKARDLWMFKNGFIKIPMPRIMAKAEKEGSDFSDSERSNGMAQI